MSGYTNSEVIEVLSNKAVEKSKLKSLKLIILGIMGGAFIALGYLAFVRICGTTPKEWGSLNAFLGGALFPLGLMGITFIGGELVTGNMMTMTLGVLSKKITINDLVKNWLVIMFLNAIGGLIVAYLFGHIAGLTEGDFAAKTIAVAQAKVNDTPLVAFVSGIGCNIFVCMAVWMAAQAKDYIGKIFGIWFPIMAFVTIGFQHVVANAFIIPAGIFTGTSGITWGDYFLNILIVFLGNIVGGSLFLGVPAYIMNKKS